MGARICFDRHIHIGNETRINGILSQLGYADINEQMLNEIGNNKRLKWIQISDCLPNEAYQKIDQILLVRPDITFRLFHFINYHEIDISFLMNMPHMKRLQIDCIDFKSNPNRINLSVLAELNLKLLRLESFFPYCSHNKILQGSYGRGEATETSDIDAVVILDELTVTDIQTYSIMLDTLPYRELICGFLSGKDEIMN